MGTIGEQVINRLNDLDAIVQAVGQEDYKMQTLIREIILSVSFRTKS